jgi:hypothetical protein
MLGIAGLLVVLCAMILGAIIQGAAGPLVADWLPKGYASWPM